MLLQRLHATTITGHSSNQHQHNRHAQEHKQITNNDTTKCISTPSTATPLAHDAPYTNPHMDADTHQVSNTSLHLPEMIQRSDLPMTLSSSLRAHHYSHSQASTSKIDRFPTSFSCKRRSTACWKKRAGSGEVRDEMAYHFTLSYPHMHDSCAQNIPLRSEE